MKFANIIPIHTVIEGTNEPFDFELPRPLYVTLRREARKLGIHWWEHTKNCLREAFGLSATNPEFRARLTEACVNEGGSR